MKAILLYGVGMITMWLYLVFGKVSMMLLCKQLTNNRINVVRML